ncbi:MAG: NeuD/PglB/VioB family sugar acetyltransferase [Bacteroidetes bacterium]|nr:NeuD/PglB/VioB family sugar acetyltransferase [Bacteroidota bacterium]
MLVVGAKGHAKEILELLYQQNKLNGLYFYDDISDDLGEILFGQFPIIRSLKDVQKHFINNPEFILGLGNPSLRKMLSVKLIEQGGKLISIIAKSSSIGHFDVQLENGINIMQNAMISNSVRVEMGTLINAFVSIHHDVIIEEFCEVSPHAILLGGCKIGAFTYIGTNATILPNIIIGNNVVVGAGALVTKNLPDNAVAIGVPARIIYFKDSIY